MALLERDRGKTALQLVAVLRRALGNEQVGADDDFFAAGGDSLAAAELFAFIERQLGLRLPLTTLSQRPTMRGLAALIEAREPRARTPIAVWVNAGAAGARPLFCVAGRGADALVQVTLARLMGAVPWVALEYEGADGGEQAYRPLAAIARRFADEVQRLEPRGPYRLLGASFGGRVMFEVARVLMARGQAIELLAMLDTHAPGARRPRAGLSSLDRLRLAADQLRHETFARAGGLGPIAAGLRQRWRLARARLALARDGRTTPPFERRWDTMQAVLMHAGRRCHHAPLDVRVELLRCERQRDPRLWETDGELGWGGRARGGVGVQVIPGGHREFWSMPVAGVVAERLRVLLGRSA